jgi:dTDP-3-amino-3,4,6-trideoxy-alpha-D-glucose transaminase
VVLDSLRYDFALKVPALAQMAKQGRWFERMYAASTFTYASLSSLRTGLYPPHHNWRTWPKGGPLRAADTLESCLEGAGYHISNTMEVPFQREQVTELKRPACEPFFRFCWFTAIHDHLCAYPIWGGTPPATYQTYLEDIGDYLGRVQALFGDCLLLVVADHGMGLKGDTPRQYSRYDVGAGTLYDFRVRVPCLFLGPGVEPEIVDDTYSLVDVLPMALELLGLPIPDGLDGAVERDGPVYMEAQSPYSQWPSKTPNVFGATDGRIKVVETPDGIEVYDLGEVPLEKHSRMGLLDEGMLAFMQGVRKRGDTMGVKFMDLRPDSRLRCELDAAYERVMSSGRYIGGYEVEAFEKEWADYCQVEHCVACGNGFDALQLVLRAEGIGPDDIVVVPEWTAVATWAAVEAVGARPLVPNASWERWIPFSQAAIIAVHLYGIASTTKQDYSLDVSFIKDGAQSHGMVTYTSRDANSGTTTWSFYPTKNLGCYGDGGAITTPSPSLAAALRELRRYGAPHAINSCLDPLQAAFLRVKLPYLDGWNETRRQHAARYLDGLKDVPDITLPSVPEWCEPVWHQFVIQTPKRDELRACLDTHNIETMIHYPVPPHRALGYDYDLPEADRLAREVLSLPVAPHLTDDDIDTVIEAIIECA